MTKSIEKNITDKWKNILNEYEKLKQKKSIHFTTVHTLCEVYGISRKQLRKYYGRWLHSGKKNESLLPRKRGPTLGQYRMLTKERERMLVKIQRRFEAKPIDIWCMINGIWELHPSVKTIARTLKRYPKNKRKEIIHRYEKKVPGELVHGDTFDIPKIVFQDREQRYLSGILDDCTRLNYVQMIEKKTALNVGNTILRAGKWLDLHGISIETFMSDNGTEYTSVFGRPKGRANHIFEIMLGYVGIRHIYTKPYTPKTNGKIERFWKLLKEEFLPGVHDVSVKEFNSKLKKFMYYYNYQRPHGGIHYQTPLQKLQFVTETLG